MVNVIVCSVLLVVMLVATFHHYLTQRRGVRAITAYVAEVTASHEEIHRRISKATEKLENLKKLVAEHSRRA